MQENTIKAALIVLTILQVVMITSLFAGVAPHPPASTPLFGMGPFVGASIALAIAAIVIGPLTNRWSRALCVAAVLTALISFGPQKYFDPQFSLVWPSVIVGQLAALTIFIQLFKAKQ